MQYYGAVHRYGRLALVLQRDGVVYAGVFTHASVERKYRELAAALWRARRSGRARYGRFVGTCASGRVCGGVGGYMCVGRPRSVSGPMRLRSFRSMRPGCLMRICCLRRVGTRAATRSMA